MSRDIFDIIILNGRPAAGKSEVIDYLKSVPVPERIRRFHIGEFDEFDDFPILWERFEDDDIFARHGFPRAHTTEDYYFKDHFFWNFLIERLNISYQKATRDDPSYHDTRTALIEFSRGGERGFEEAYGYLAPAILERAGIVYIKVSYEESVRKNQRRANKDRPDSILQHSLPDDKMEFYYRKNDWDRLAAQDPHFINVNGSAVPYSVLENEPEVTDDPERLGRALEKVFGDLWSVYRERTR